MSTLSPTLNPYRHLLTKLRGGDYFHAGGIEAIDMVLQKILAFDPDIKTKATLDVGSGFGGTADYLYQQGFKEVYGIDLDQAAITYASDKYPSIHFTAANALNVDQIYFLNYFSFIYFFNVIYAIQDKADVLKKVAAISKPGCILAVFDYAHGQKNQAQPLKDLADNTMYPIDINQFKRDLSEAGWEVLEVMNLTSHYMIWYKSLLNILSTPSPLLGKEYSRQNLSRVRETFTLLLDQLEQGLLEGAVIYARKTK